ncbi:MAG: dihydrofolate reductase family protein [Armatimonadota bacterium]
MAGVSGVYPDLFWPQPPEDRPYIAVNMIATLDGKIVGGKRGEPVDLGSTVDKATMRQIEAKVDGIMIGHGTLKASPSLWYPPGPKRYVVSGRGKVKPVGRFFTDDPSTAYVVTTEGANAKLENKIASPGDRIDWKFVLGLMRRDHGVRTLLCEGGSDLNASLMSLDLVDELFLTLAPVLKLGRDVPTIADGEPLDRAHLQRFVLLENHANGSELFLRYRRERSA